MVSALTQGPQAVRGLAASSKSGGLPRRVRGAVGPLRASGGEMQKSAGPRSAHDQITGVVFDPFAEVQSELKELEAVVGNGVIKSLARSNYAEDLEAAVNYQINAELNFSYVYTSMAAFFGRDDVGLPGFAKYFCDQSHDERHHAELLMDHQNRRGGRVTLATIMAPQIDFYNDERGEALWAMELSLAMEKLNFTKLRELHALADRMGDPEFTHFLEHCLLEDQAQEVKKVADYVSMLRRVGKGHGTWHFDRYLYDGGVGTGALDGAN